MRCDYTKAAIEKRRKKNITKSDIAKGIKVHGFTHATDIATEILLKIPKTAEVIRGTITISIVTWSFENLVIILPIGFVSKNDIFACRTLATIVLCILVEPTRIMIIKTTDLM